MGVEYVVLEKFRAEEQQEYANIYQKMVSEKTPRLDVRDLRKLCSPKPIKVSKSNPDKAVVMDMLLECSEKTIIGRSIPKMLGFDDFLALERFSGLEIDQFGALDGK